MVVDVSPIEQAVSHSTPNIASLTTVEDLIRDIFRLYSALSFKTPHQANIPAAQPITAASLQQCWLRAYVSAVA